MKTNDLLKAIENLKTRSQWDKGVKDYAYEIVEYVSSDYANIDADGAKEILLNGAESWVQYSYGGLSLIYDKGIAERLCTPSELKKATRKDGTLKDMANSRENWIECQARALNQAYNKIMNILREGK